MLINLRIIDFLADPIQYAINFRILSVILIINSGLEYLFPPAWIPFLYSPIFTLQIANHRK